MNGLLQGVGYEPRMGRAAYAPAYDPAVVTASRAYVDQTVEAMAGDLTQAVGAGRRRL